MPRNVVATAPKRAAWAKELNEREFLFVSVYLGSFNGTKAALAAGCPKASAHAQAWEIKQRPHVREAIEAGLREAMPMLKLTLAERLTAIAEADSADFMQLVEKRIRSKDPKSGKQRTFKHMTVALTPTAQLSDRQRAAVKGLKQRVGLYGTTIELQLYDPLAAADRLKDLLNLAPQEKAAGIGGVVFVIETPDGTTMKTISQAGSPIDRAAIDAQIAADAEPVEDLPPGARLLIETP